jgi:hypothetical protein
MHGLIPHLAPPTKFALDTQNVGDALALLRTIPSESTKLIFWDPQFDQLLQKLKYGNRGISRGQRREELPVMTPEYM